MSLQFFCLEAHYDEVEASLKSIGAVESVASLPTKKGRNVFVQFRSEGDAEAALQTLKENKNIVLPGAHKTEKVAAAGSGGDGHADGPTTNTDATNERRRRDGGAGKKSGEQKNVAGEFFLYNSYGDRRQQQQQQQSRQQQQQDPSQQQQQQQQQRPARRRQKPRAQQQEQTGEATAQSGGDGERRAQQPRHRNPNQDGTDVAPQQNQRGQQGPGGRGRHPYSRGGRGGRGQYQRPRIPMIQGFVAVLDNVPVNATNDQLAQLFANCGGLIYDINRLENMAMVYLDTSDAVQNAITQINGHSFMNRVITVSSGGSVRVPAPIVAPPPPPPGEEEGRGYPMDAEVPVVPL